MKLDREKKGFPDGWKMTFAQRAAYWWMFNQIAEKMGWKYEEMDARREELHERAGLGRCSAKEINHLKGYDAIKGTFMAIIRDADINPQLNAITQEQKRLIFKITQEQAALLSVTLGGADPLERLTAADRMIVGILRDKFGTVEITDLASEKRPRIGRNGLETDKSELEMLRDTIDRLINDRRAALDISIHDLHKRAGVKCATYCAQCHPPARRVFQMPPVEQPF